MVVLKNITCIVIEYAFTRNSHCKIKAIYCSMTTIPSNIRTYEMSEFAEMRVIHCM